MNGFHPVKAHITGTVWKIVVAIGDEVSEDEDLVILESMKMEMPLGAPLDGFIRAIHVVEGDAVQEGQLVIEIEPA
jgi:acetyl-CoA carboxylase biotin carboxyl carrier protein